MNELGEKSGATIIVSTFVNKAILKFLLAYSFWKMVFIGQNLKHVHMTYYFFLTFDLLLINSRYLVLPHQKNVVSEYKLHGKPIVK